MTCDGRKPRWANAIDKNAPATVMPAQAGIQGSCHHWVPAFAGEAVYLRRISVALAGAIAAVTISTASAELRVEPSAQRQSELIYLLKQDCGSCHGMTLKGGLGPPLLPATLAGKPEQLLVNTVLFGRPGTAMPPWQGLLVEAEARWLIGQLRQGVADGP